MKRTRIDMSKAAAPLLLLGWIILVLQRVEEVAGVSLWVGLACAGLGVIAVVVDGRRDRTRAALAAVGLLVVIACGAQFASQRDPENLSERWRRQQSWRICEVTAAVADRVENLQRLSTRIGEQLSRFVQGEGQTHATDSLGVRLDAFNVLGTLAGDARRSGRLPAGLQIGIQLLDAEGRRIAWAGWPQPLEPADRRFVESGKELVYSRQVSLYRILTHLIPITDGQGVVRGTGVVDMPLEVNYKVNNKFLKSTGPAEDVARAAVANVRFDYFQAPNNLPRTIDGHRARLAERNELLAKTKRRGKSGVAADSVLAQFGFPAYVEPVGTIAGSESSGLVARAVVRSVLGNPLFNITVTGHPFHFFVENHHDQVKLVVLLLALLALLVLFILSLKHFPRRFSGPLRAVEALYLVAFFVFVRYWVLSLPTDLVTKGVKLFDPAIFATPFLGGLMRSAGDLLITALFFVTALYGVLKITREGAVAESEEPRPTPGLYLLKALVAAVVLFGVFELTERFIGSLVVNANPRLVGETMRLLEWFAALLHLSTFLMVGGIFLAGMILIWGVYRLRGWKGSGRASLLTGGLVILAGIVMWRWEFSFILLLLLSFIVFAPRIVRREDLVSIVIAAFVFVVIVSTSTYVLLNREYQALRKTFIQEKVTELTHPSDNWKVFILEDVLENFSADPAIRQTLRVGDPAALRRLAFDLWAGSSLSLLGYSSAIRVFDAADSLVSRFSVEMPYRVGLAEETERLETASTQDWVVLDLTTDTPQGIVRYYRGIANVRDLVPIAEDRSLTSAVGKVVVDMPFFFENLAWSARTGPQTPEVLRNVQEGGIEPRLEEPEALLLARLKENRVIESSSDALTAGFALDADLLDKAKALEWPILKSAEHTYRFLIQDTDRAGTSLLAGFLVPRPIQHLLRWSTILSLYFFFTVAIIILIIGLKSLPFLGTVLPTLTPGRQLGFQQKLLGSFLAVALLPPIFLGVFSVRIIKQRFVEENKKEALYKSFNASKALGNVVTGELEYLIEHTDLRQLIGGEIPRYFHRDPGRVIRVFSDGGELPSAGGAEPSRQQMLNLLAGFPAERAFIHWVDDVPHLAALSRPIHLVLDGATRTYVVYYARRVDGDLLGQVADEVGADVNVYDHGQLVASSREGLLSGGFISFMMNAEAYVNVSLMDVDHSLVTETAGQYRYEVSFLPIPSAGPDEKAALGVPLLFQPESYHLEVQKTTSIVLSLFALLSAATIGLGLLLARGIFEPLRGLLEGTKRISRGDLSFKLPATRGDEIGTVVSAFNEMTGQLSRSQTALEERRRYLEIILANIGTGVISTDENDRILSINNAAERILGVRRADVKGKTGDELVGQNVVPQFFSLFAPGALASRPFVSSEVDILKNGTRRTIKYMRTQLNTDGRYLGTVYVFEDLTELINSKKLSAWVEMARQIAHEIKNPLTPIKLSTQFMVKAYEEKAGDFDAIFKESSETIIHQVEVLKRIASEFSSFGRLQELDVTSHRIVPLLKNIITPYEKNASGIAITAHWPDPSLEAAVDAEAVRKICTNLIENAMEAMPSGGTLEVTCSETTFNGHSGVRVTFRDTGPGLSDEVMDRLFEPYFSTKTTGTGLGLAICRSLSREMGGEVTVKNLDEGHGVEAVLWLKNG